MVVSSLLSRCAILAQARHIHSHQKYGLQSVGVGDRAGTRSLEAPSVGGDDPRRSPHPGCVVFLFPQAKAEDTFAP